MSPSDKQDNTANKVIGEPRSGGSIQLPSHDELEQYAEAAVKASRRLVANANNEAACAAQYPSVQRPLKICITGYRSAPFGGGQGIYIKYLSKALVDAGHDVDVISGQPYPHLDPRVKLIKMPGLDLFTNGLGSLRPRHLNSMTNIIEWFSKLTGGFAEPYCFSRRVSKYLHREGTHYDIIHDNQCLGWGMLKVQRRGFNLLTTIHHPITSDLDIALNASGKWWERLLIRRWHAFLVMQKKVAARLDHVVTVSERSRGDIAAAFGLSAEAIHLVYNGIDTEEFRPMPEVARKPWQIIATASADQPLKGLRFLLLALAQLAGRYPQITLLLVSKPKPGGETEQLIAKLNLAKHIRFVHGVSTEVLVKHYAESSIAVVPSLYEGFGLPAGEAMACGVPVVATNGGALPEVVGDAGVVVGVKDADAIATSIEALLNDEVTRKRYGELGRLRIENSFSWSLAATQMTELYHDVINNSKQQGEFVVASNDHLHAEVANANG